MYSVEVYLLYVLGGGGGGSNGILDFWGVLR